MDGAAEHDEEAAGDSAADDDDGDGEGDADDDDGDGEGEGDDEDDADDEDPLSALFEGTPMIHGRRLLRARWLILVTRAHGRKG